MGAGQKRFLPRQGGRQRVACKARRSVRQRHAGVSSQIPPRRLLAGAPSEGDAGCGAVNDQH